MRAAGPCIPTQENIDHEVRSPQDEEVSTATRGCTRFSHDHFRICPARCSLNRNSQRSEGARSAHHGFARASLGLPRVRARQDHARRRPCSRRRQVMQQDGDLSHVGIRTPPLRRPAKVPHQSADRFRDQAHQDDAETAGQDDPPRDAREEERRAETEGQSGFGEFGHGLVACSDRNAQPLGCAR